MREENRNREIDLPPSSSEEEEDEEEEKKSEDSDGDQNKDEIKQPNQILKVSNEDEQSEINKVEDKVKEISIESDNIS